MVHFRNIIHALKCGTQFRLIYYYVFNLLFGKKIFKKNISIKENFEKKIDNLKFKGILIGLEMQVINYNIPYLYQALFTEQFLNKKIEGLIIGCYEGHSSLFFLTSCINTNFTCVDMWDKEKLSIGYNGNAESYFDKNINLYKNRVKKVKSDSQSFLNKNNDKYDLIYLDGAHDPIIVEADCSKSFEFLNHGGILIINSIFWQGFSNPRSNNLFGIVNFMKNYKNFKILNITRNTLILKKK